MLHPQPPKVKKRSRLSRSSSNSRLKPSHETFKHTRRLANTPVEARDSKPPMQLTAYNENIKRLRIEKKPIIFDIILVFFMFSLPFFCYYLMKWFPV